MFQPLSRYADFQGRSGRKEFWLWVLVNIIIIGVAYALIIADVASSVSSATIDADGNLVATNPSMGMLSIIGFCIIGIWSLATFIPSIAVTVRRLHDQDKTGWLYLLNFVPIGNIVLLVFMFLEGTRGPNQYGPDPRGY